MADSTATQQKRVLPARQRRESAAKRRAMSPATPATPATPDSPATPMAVATPPSTTEPRVKRKYTKRASIAHNLNPARSASTGTSNPDESLPTSMKISRPLPVTVEAQSEKLSSKQYQSIAESAVLAASLQRSRMQWLCDGVFKKYWTKPVKRKGVIEQPPNNPDIKTMQKLGNATITIEPHTFDVTFFVVRDTTAPMPPLSAYKQPIQPSFKPSPGPPIPKSLAPPQTVQSSGPGSTNLATSSSASTLPSASTQATNPTISSPSPLPATRLPHAPPSPRAHTPAAPAASAAPAVPPSKTADPVIQMLASRAAIDNNLKELMKVVATSRASPEQLKEFQAHIDEINGIVKKQNAENAAREKKAAKAAISTPAPRAPVAAHPATYNANVHRNSPLNPTPSASSQFNTYVQPRLEAPVKYVVMEFTSPLTGQAVTSDRWLFPDHVVLDLVYGGTDMTCSFLVERKGSEVLATMKDLTSEEMQTMTSKWHAEKEYFQPVTMHIKATQHRTIETIARNAKALPEVVKYMEEVMKIKNRAPQEFLIHRLPTDKSDDFTDSAVELSAEDENVLRDTYPM